MITSCCNLPNRILLVDDDEEFLKIISDTLKFEKYKSVCISNLAQAEELISKNKNWTDNLLNRQLSRGFDETDTSALSMKMHISSLKDQVYNQNRFYPFTILVVDFDIPGKNGLEFIRGINNPNLKIIMLTGKAAPEVVIKAFNDREIHRYISKGDLDYINTLVRYVQELQKEFYADFFKVIIEILKKETNILENINYTKIFEQIIKENNIIEYYLADESGSFFLQDDTAKNQVFLVVKSEQDLKDLFEMASEDRNMPAYTLKKLKNRELIPFFITEQEKLHDPRNWKLFEAKPVSEAKKFYYAIVMNDEDLEMDRSRIKSYVDFLNESE